MAMRGGTADLVLVSGKVRTPGHPSGFARALAVRGGTIVAVGGDDEIGELTGPGTRVIDLDGRLALPIVVRADFIGEGNNPRAGRVVLNGGGWTVTLDAIEGCNERQDSLQRESGYAITHAGRLARADRSTFTADEARDALGAILYTLSFASGQWVSPVLPVGYSEQGDPIWACWEHPSVDVWRAANTVADPDDARAPARFFRQDRRRMERSVQARSGNAVNSLLHPSWERRSPRSRPCRETT